MQRTHAVIAVLTTMAIATTKINLFLEAVRHVVSLNIHDNKFGSSGTNKAITPKYGIDTSG